MNYDKCNKKLPAFYTGRNLRTMKKQQHKDTTLF